MLLDGSNHQVAAVPKQQNPDNRVSGEKQVIDRTAHETRLAATVTPQDADHVSAVLHDSFEHVSETANTATYSDDVAGHSPEGVISGAFEGVRASLEQPQVAEIVDLETARNADGLPLLPETDDAGALTQDVLKAYGVGGASTDKGTSGTTPSDLLDTLG